MSKYTTEVRWLIETGWDFGLKEYPIFDELYRNALNAKILDHFYFREIGLETAALFNRFLNRKMSEIMPYYNQLYNSTLIEISPLTRLDYSEEFDSTKHGTDNLNSTLNSTINSTTDVNTNSTNQGVNSETPQNVLLSDNLVGQMIPASTAVVSKDSEDQSNTTNASNENTANNDRTIDNTDHYLKKIMGNNAGRTDSEMLLQFRNTFLNIDMLIIGELEPLFMSIW